MRVVLSSLWSFRVWGRHLSRWCLAALYRGGGCVACARGPGTCVIILAPSTPVVHHGFNGAVGDCSSKQAWTCFAPTPRFR